MEQFVVHHRLNKAKGGAETLDNGEARHSKCEAECHELFLHGNPSEGYGKNSRECEVNRGYYRERREQREKVQHSGLQAGRKATVSSGQGRTSEVDSSAGLPVRRDLRQGHASRNREVKMWRQRLVRR